MFVIDLVANLMELYLRTSKCVYVRTDLYMKLHSEYTPSKHMLHSQKISSKLDTPFTKLHLIILRSEIK